MGREIRRVPVDFEHPRSERGGLQPMFKDTLFEAQEEWDLEVAAFLANDDEAAQCTPEEYFGERPWDSSYYRPEEWPPEHERGWVVYETVSEGTPVTPCFSTAKELVLHLADEGTIADPPMSYEAAEVFVKDGWAPSMISYGGVVMKGLAAYESDGPFGKSTTEGA